MSVLRATWAVALALLAGLPVWGQSARTPYNPQAHNPQTQNRRSAWVVADFNGDDKVDLVSLSSLIGEPHAQFGPLDSSLPGASPFARERLRARDLDGDTDRDLVLESEWSVAIAVWINDGAGNFRRANLEDFRFQLSRDESRRFGSTAIPLPSELTDDSPRCAAPARPLAVGLHLAAVNAIAAAEEFRQTPVCTGPAPRGPPSLP